MAISDLTLARVSDLVRTELPRYLPPDVFVISEIAPKVLPGPDEDEYVGVRVILEDGHPKLDPRVLNSFTLYITSLCEDRGLERPIVSYANRSEIPV